MGTVQPPELVEGGARLRQAQPTGGRERLLLMGRGQERTRTDSEKIISVDEVTVHAP